MTDPLVVDELTIEHLIPWFRGQEHLLRGEPSRIAVLIRGGSVMDKTITSSGLDTSELTMVQAIFCKERNKVVQYRPVEANRLAEDLVRMFGDKDMIIFQ